MHCTTFPQPLVVTIVTIDILRLLSPNRTRFGTSCQSKKRVLETIAALIAEDFPAIDASELFRLLIERERLGSTGLGNGVAIPHCRVPNCPSLIGALITLEEPVDFAAIDGEPVDLIFTLLVPQEAAEQHLQTLAGLVEVVGQESYRQQLRNSGSDEALYQNMVALFSANQ